MYDRHGITCKRTTCPEALLQNLIPKFIMPLNLDNRNSLDTAIEKLQNTMKKMQTKLDRLTALKAQFVAVQSSIDAVLKSGQEAI